MYKKTQFFLPLVILPGTVNPCGLIWAANGRGLPWAVPVGAIVVMGLPVVEAAEAKVEVGDRLRKMIIIPSTENLPAGVKAETQEIAFGNKIDGVDITSLLKNNFKSKPHKTILYYHKQNNLNKIKKNN